MKRTLLQYSTWWHSVRSMVESVLSARPQLLRTHIYTHQVYIALKTKKTHGFNSCIVISIYPLDVPSIEKATEYCNN